MAPVGRLVVVLFSVAMATIVLGLQFDKNRELVVYQGAPAGTIVGTLTVSRAAGRGLAGNHVNVFYTLHQSNTSDFQDFNLDTKTGRLSMARKVDRQVNSTYQIIARARLANANSGDTLRLRIRVIEPPQSSDPSLLLMEPNQFEAEVEPESPVGMTVFQAVAHVNGSLLESPGNITYFMEPSLPGDVESLATIKDWFEMDSRTGVVRLLKSPGSKAAHNVSFIIGARERDKALEIRAPATVLFHDLTRPRNLTVAKLSADAADICWRFPLGAGARGYVLRYWRHSPSTDDDSTTTQGSPSPSSAVQELKIIDVDVLRPDAALAATSSSSSSNEEEMRTVCSSLKHLESEAAYKLQVSACRDAGAGCAESVGPSSAILHFTTQTNECLVEGTCVTGECQILFEPPGFECLCHSGNYGRRCELYNPCVLSPCQNGATCRNYTNSTHDCLCPEGYEGGDCTVQVGPACLHQEPCLNNGTCSTDGCVCLGGYTGHQCQTYDPCWDDPCPKKANCTVLPVTREYHCVCPIGYRGRDCDEAIDYCVLDPCQNDGQCTSKDGSYHCQCTGGYTGVACEQDVDECETNPCQNNSTCLNHVGSFNCLCPPGFTGARCEEREEPCRSSPCKNKGVCQNDYVRNSYTCFCRPGFSGRDCETDIDDCKPNPCLNGGSCRDLTDDFECNCPKGYLGHICDHEEQCPEEVEESVDKGSFRWPVTDPGKNVTLSCPYGLVSPVNRSAPINMEITDSETRQQREPDPSAVRSCRRLDDGTVTWMKSELSVCRDQKLAIAEQKAVKLENSSSTGNLTLVQVEQVATELVNLVDDALVDHKVANNLFNTLSNVMEVDNQVLSASTNSTELILDAIDRYTSSVPLEPDQPIVMATPNIAIETVVLGSSPRDSYSFRPSFEGDDTNSMITLTVPREAFGESSDGVRLRFVSYRSGKLFQSRNNRLPGQPGVVLSATVGHLSVSGLSEPVTYTMPIMNSSSFYSCVYWNELEREWSNEGVKTRKTDSGMIECLSDHLTAFSVLLDPTPMDRISGYHEYILRLISYVGSGLSILGLSITVLLYSLFRNLRRDRGGKILLNLSISLLMLNIIFLVGSVIGYAWKNVDLEQRAKSSDRVWSAGTEPTVSQANADVCTALTIGVHYLVLSSLSWMLVEAVHMYQLLILVFANSETCFMLKRMASAWGVPLIVVITTATVCLEYYQDKTGDSCGRMSQDHLAVYYGAFIGPTCLILLINSVVFVMVLRVILMQGRRGRAVGKVATENGNGAGGGNRLMIMAQLRGAVTVMALLGVTWVAGAIAIGPIKVFMSYVFCICNSLQGFVIFIVRVVQYPEARQSFITLWNTGQTHIPYDATRHSSGPTTNSSGSAVQHSVAGQQQGGFRARKTMSTNSKSPGSAGRMISVPRGPDDSLTPSQAPTLPLGGPGDSSSLSSYQHWFPTSGTASPASNGSSQSRFRRIFGQLGLEPSSLRLSSSKSNGKSGSHSLLERHVSGATNPPPSPGDKSHQMLSDQPSLPEELIKPNFIIGEEISLLHSGIASADSSVKRSSVHSLPGLSKEGANTSWTYLRPEDELGEPYQMGKGSVPTLKSPYVVVERRRASSFLAANVPSSSGQHRRSLSYQETAQVTFPDGPVSLPRALHS